jgi:hypothetical protein
VAPTFPTGILVALPVEEIDDESILTLGAGMKEVISPVAMGTQVEELTEKIALQSKKSKVDILFLSDMKNPFYCIFIKEVLAF